MMTGGTPETPMWVRGYYSNARPQICGTGMAQHQDPERRVAAQLAWLRMYPKAGNEVDRSCGVPVAVHDTLQLPEWMAVCEHDV